MQQLRQVMHRQLAATVVDAMVDGVVDVKAVGGTVVDSVDGIVVEGEEDRVAERLMQAMLHNLVTLPRHVFIVARLDTLHVIAA